MAIMWLLQLLSASLLIGLTGSQVLETTEQSCLMDSANGCRFARPPQYMIMAPSRIRPNQIFQVFTTILRMEYGQESVYVFVSIIKGNKEYASTALRFDRPSSRIMQLRMPANAESGQYHLRVEGKLTAQDTGNIWFNETKIDFNTKQASLFLQLSKPIYKQGQKVHFRIIPILPNMMPKYGSMVVYVDDPTGIPVRRWQALQTNAGGIISQSFQLSDQPNYGKWHVRVDAFGHVYKHPFTVEEFWEPRFDVNVSIPPYVMETENTRIRGVVLANHTSGRPCIGNASITAFFRPREEVWNMTEGWKKPWRDARSAGMNNQGVPMEEPAYKPVIDIPIKDYHMYFAYEYRFVPYFDGRINFEWTQSQLEKIARRGGETGQLTDSEIIFFANVTDWYSSLNRTGFAGTVMFTSKIKLSWVGEPIRSFKPQSMMKVQVAVSKFDGTPVRSGGTVTITDDLSGNLGNSLMSGPQTRVPVNGIAEFEFNIGVNTRSLKLTATFNEASGSGYGNYNNLGGVRTSSITMLATRYYSPTGSFISVITSTDHPRVNEYMIFHVKTSYFVPRIYYQVIAQSNIIIGDELEMTSKQKTFAVALSREMVPTARLLVYYIRGTDELVTDVLNFFVNGTQQNQVKLEINRGKDFSRDTIEFNAYADPGSYVVFSGMLQDLYTRGMSDGITENRLIDELMSYDSMASNTYRQLWRVSDTDFEYKFFNGPDYGIDANTSFTGAGLVVLTDARVPRLFNEQACRVNVGGFPCFSAQETQCFTEAQRCDGQIDCENDGADEYMCSEEEEIAGHHRGLDRISRVMRFYDNSSWAWQEIFVKPDGRVDFRVEVPKYPLTWVINGLSISRNLGLGIMQRPVRYDASRYMYIQVEHPTHIVRGEQIGVRVTIFNYWYEDDYLEVLVTMHGGPGKEFVSVGEMGIVSSYRPNTHRGDAQTIVFLEPGESKDIYMPIVPDKDLVYGKMDFRVTATCFMERDSYDGVMYVKADGVMNYYHTPYLIDLIKYPSVQIPSFDVVVPEEFRKPEVRENQYVPQSPKSWISLFGDVVSPGFFVDYLNAENLLYRPYGGCEMVTFNFAYNRLTLQFMKASQQLGEDQLLKSLKQMRIALQRIMGYMNQTDGSFRMFRDDNRPSLWLTAFVAKTLDAANFGEWERELFIPKELINKMVLYMCSRQNQTGAFDPEPHDTTYDRKMASAKASKQDKLMADPIPLTAYVLIALFDISSASGDAAACIDTARRDGANFLSLALSDKSITEPFHLAITMYALTLSQKRAPYKDLWEIRRDDASYVYFADEFVMRNPTETLNNIIYKKPRQELQNDGYAVQTTAYALLAHIKSNQGAKYEREMMMSWLSNMRNSIGGMASTQDTIVAMEALYKFTQKDPHRNVFDLMVTTQSSSDADWVQTMELKKWNYIQLLKEALYSNKVYGYMNSVAQGNGRAMLQVTTQVNVEYSWLLKTTQINTTTEEPMKFFDLYVDQLTFGGRNESIMKMDVCGSWVHLDKSMTSGLAVMEIDVPTGYMVMNDTLRDYVRSAIVPNLKRAEFYERKVLFYFDYLDVSKTCVHFRADRWYPVANATIQHRMRLYDYYEPGMHNTTMYITKNLFLLNICFACGSFQCPYCPYFNAASVLQAGLSCSLFVLAVFVVQRLMLRGSVR